MIFPTLRPKLPPERKWPSEIGFTMDDMSQHDLGPAPDLHAEHKMSGMHGSHDGHAGHSVAMFRDKFWLSFALTIPVVF